MSLFSQINETWQSLVDLIIRPPRHEYDAQKDLGENRILVRGKVVLREDFELINGRGFVIKCSHFQPAEPCDQEGEEYSRLRPRSDPFPCVVYCHGNAGSRVDALPLIPLLLPHGVSVCCFDFSGAGQSEGQYISLGYFEKEDLRTVVDFLRAGKHVSRIGLWGHSMGACTSLLYASDRADESVCAMVLDSSFSTLDAVIAETAASAKHKLSESGMVPGMRLMPDMLIPMAVAAIRRSILSQAGFDIKEVNPVDKCARTLIPALFGHGDDDEMVAPYHSQRLHSAYGGNTTLLRFVGSHNSERGDMFIGSVTAFLIALLRPSGEAHPAEGLLYAQPCTLRGLMGRPAQAERSGFTAGKGFQSGTLGMAGDQCAHRGRTAGNLSLLVKLCCNCNPAIRPPPRAVSRRYRLFTPPADPSSPSQSSNTTLEDPPPSHHDPPHPQPAPDGEACRHVAADAESGGAGDAVRQQHEGHDGSQGGGEMSGEATGARGDMEEVGESLVVGSAGTKEEGARMEGEVSIDDGHGWPNGWAGHEAVA